MSRKFWTEARLLAALGLLAITQIVVAGDFLETMGGSCPQDSCRKVCRPTVELKKVTKRVYDTACEDFCLPKCSLLGGLLGHGAGCGEGNACPKCERPRTRKYLVVKIRHHEECENKCVVEHEACPVTMPCLEPGAEAPVTAPVLINK